VADTRFSDPSAKALADAKQYISENLDGVISAQVPDGKPGTLTVFQDRAQAMKNAWIVVEVGTTFHITFKEACLISAAI
jgi:hypothetical protein